MWIEIILRIVVYAFYESLPSRECGLKFLSRFRVIIVTVSLPSRECGLKYIIFVACTLQTAVTPFAGVWIEIQSYITAMIPDLVSLPSRECGLKYFVNTTARYS